MTKHLIINVVNPGQVKLGNIKLTPMAKLMLYQLHDMNPKCTVGELRHYVDIIRIPNILRELLAARYAVIDGNKLNIYNIGQAEEKTTVKDTPEYQLCREYATELGPKIAKAYHQQSYNEYALAAYLHKVHKDLNVNIEVLGRACKWIGEHVADGDFPVISNPFHLFNKWGWIVNYHHKWKERMMKSKRNYL